MGYQFPMSAPFRYFPPFQYDDLVRVPDGGKTVGHNQAGAAPAPDVFQTLLFCHGIDGAGGFVKDQQGWVAGQRPGNFQTLPLTAAAPGQFPDAAADRR